MPAILASAPGKVILFGEHAVVYGHPAIAVPVGEVKAKAIINANPLGSPDSVHIQAPGIGIDTMLADLPGNNPLAAVVLNVKSALEIPRLPACKIRVTSTIPIASGLGSSAAVSVAIIRALSSFLGISLLDEQVSQIAFEVEKLHHGTPSGIDNTVIAYNMPVYFQSGQRIERFSIGVPIPLVIADSGISSPTAQTVSDVRRAWQAEPLRYEAMFNKIGDLVRSAKGAIEAGLIQELGELMNENHRALDQMGVSSPELEGLITAAREAGALGAKLCGSGRGGNIIALAETGNITKVAAALESAGAVRTLTTQVGI